MACRLIDFLIDVRDLFMFVVLLAAASAPFWLLVGALWLLGTHGPQ